MPMNDISYLQNLIPHTKTSFGERDNYAWGSSMITPVWSQAQATLSLKFLVFLWCFWLLPTSQKHGRRWTKLNCPCDSLRWTAIPFRMEFSYLMSSFPRIVSGFALILKLFIFPFWFQNLYQQSCICTNNEQSYATKLLVNYLHIV